MIYKDRYIESLSLEERMVVADAKLALWLSDFITYILIQAICSLLVCSAEIQHKRIWTTNELA
jgi:hypothetical protein